MTTDIDAIRHWTGRIKTETVVERTAQAVALRHIGLLTAFDGSDIADELYEQGEKAERYDISKALEASSDTAEVQAVRERLEQIVTAVREDLNLAVELEKARAERDEYAADNNRLVGELIAANRRADGLQNDLDSATKANTAWANGSNLTADEVRTAASGINAYIRLCGHRLPADHSLRSLAAKLSTATAEAVAR